MSVPWWVWPQVNKCKQLSSNDHQMSLAEGVYISGGGYAQRGWVCSGGGYILGLPPTMWPIPERQRDTGVWRRYLPATTVACGDKCESESYFEILVFHNWNIYIPFFSKTINNQVVHRTFNLEIEYVLQRYSSLHWKWWKHASNLIRTPAGKLVPVESFKTLSIIIEVVMSTFSLENKTAYSFKTVAFKVIKSS